MTRHLQRLVSERFDLLVVGAGIYGLCAAYDAAQRGLRVALIDRGDFAAATSFNHLRTIHGGLRYLQHGAVGRMRESIRERRTFARIAPHLMRPLAFVTPTSHRIARCRLAMGTAFLIDRVAARDRNRGIDPDLLLPASRIVSRRECLRLFPGARRSGLTGGAIWYDYQIRGAGRLNLAFAHAAARQGAVLANYVEAGEFLRRSGRIAGAGCRDVLTGASLGIEARLTLNATGPWTGRVMALMGVERTIPLFKNMNLVTNRAMSDTAWVASNMRGRALVAAPWRGRLIVGTAEGAALCEPDDTDVSGPELDGFLREIDQTFPDLRLTARDIANVQRGIVPASVRSEGRLSLKGTPELWDHEHEGAPGAISILGVKYTTARALAERVVDRIGEKLGGRLSACRTHTTPLPGGERPHPLRRSSDGVHGDDIETVPGKYGSGSAPAPGEPVIPAQVIHAVREEMACTLADVVLRRTELGSVGPPAEGALQMCADLMKRELGWTDAQAAAQMELVRRYYDLTGAPPGADPATAPGTR